MPDGGEAGAEAVAIGREAPTAEALVAPYRRDTVRAVRRRLRGAMLWFVLVVGLVVALEPVIHPERGSTLRDTYVLELAVCGLSLAASFWGAAERHMRTVAAAACASLALLMIRYNVLVAGSAERCAMFQVCLLSGIVVLLPWGWRPQLAVALASLGGFALAGPRLAANDALVYPIVGLLTGASTSVVGAGFLDRYRADAFARAALLEHTSTLRLREAETAGALAEITQALAAYLGQPDMLERLNTLALAALACDWSATFLWDERRRAFRLRAIADHRDAEWHEHLAEIDFTPELLPLLSELREGTLLEVSDAAHDSRLPTALMRRLNVASGIGTPIMRRGTVIGFLAHGHATGAPARVFSESERRLALGIADATAIALENARLIGDLQAASRLKSDFVATMSHELRTPLNVIMGYVDLLAEGTFGSLALEQADTVGRIRQSSLDLLELVNATLDLGRLEAGREAIALGPVDLQALFEELDRELGPLASADVTLRWLLEPAARQVESDRVKIKTIVKNLAGNALKFTARGSVEIRARAAAGRLTVEIRDTGIGIAAADLPVIFEMFRQVDGSSTRRFGGVGLGLYIVKRLVDLLGGTVNVESAPSVGTEFVVSVPVGLVDHLAPSRLAS